MVCHCCRRGLSLLSAWFVTVENSPHRPEEWSVAFLLGELLTLIFVLFSKNQADRPAKWRLPRLTFTAITMGFLAMSQFFVLLPTQILATPVNALWYPLVLNCKGAQWHTVLITTHAHCLKHPCSGVTSDLLAICKTGFILFHPTPSL